MHQIHALRKNSQGWHSVKTVPYCIVDDVKISAYVKECVGTAIKTACNHSYPIGFFFSLARKLDNHDIIRDCFELYTALCLISLGCRFSSDETLGMAPVTNPQSAWYGHTPVPRMVQNQINHQLELYMAHLDQKILEALQRIFKARSRPLWVVATVAVFLLLHIREFNAGRNIYCARYKDSGGFWIHPSKPKALIDEAIASCNSLLWHYAASIGQKPFELNWDDPKSRDLVGDGATVELIKELQSIRFVLHESFPGLIGRNASEVYEDGNPNSVTFTISSLLFGRMEDSKVAKFG